MPIRRKIKAITYVMILFLIIIAVIEWGSGRPLYFTLLIGVIFAMLQNMIIARYILKDK